MSKAFDLADIGFDKSSLSLLLDITTDRMRKVSVESTQSDWIKLYQGVPQGTVMGSLLFNIYINDLHLNIQSKCHITENVDDTMLYTSNQDFLKGCTELENAIKEKSEYFKKHRLNLNPSKTEYQAVCKTIKKPPYRKHVHTN